MLTTGSFSCKQIKGTISKCGNSSKWPTLCSLSCDWTYCSVIVLSFKRPTSGLKLFNLSCQFLLNVPIMSFWNTLNFKKTVAYASQFYRCCLSARYSTQNINTYTGLEGMPNYIIVIHVSLNRFTLCRLRLNRFDTLSYGMPIFLA